jgi:hypothetical protein
MGFVRQPSLKHRSPVSATLPKRQGRPQRTRVRLLLCLHDRKVEGDSEAVVPLVVTADVLSPKRPAGPSAKIALYPEGHEAHGVDLRNYLGAMRLTDDGGLLATVILPSHQWREVFGGFQRGEYRFLEIDGTCWRLRRSKVRRVSFSKMAFRSSYPDVELGVPGMM